MESLKDIVELKILIVDDTHEARIMLKNMLTEIGITQVFEASDGNEGLRFVDTAFDLVDIILCDWNMSKMTGLALLR